jgi:hypothetical protein
MGLWQEREEGNSRVRKTKCESYQDWVKIHSVHVKPFDFFQVIKFRNGRYLTSVTVIMHT